MVVKLYYKLKFVSGNVIVKNIKIFEIILQLKKS